MDLGNPDVVETSDVEELEELEGSSQGAPKISLDYLRKHADDSEIRFSPRKRMKVSNLQSFRSQYLFSLPSYYMTVFFPMLQMPPSF